MQPMSELEGTQATDWNDATETGRRMGGYTEPTMRAWRHRGEGPPYSKIGKRVMYHWPTVEGWMLGQLVTSGRNG